MNKIRTIGLILIVILMFSTNCFGKVGELQIYEENKTIPIEQALEYKNNIKNEIIIDNTKYQLTDIKEQENKKALIRDKNLIEELIVNTNDKNNVLDLFENKKQVNEEGYIGELELQVDSLDIKVNESYREEYKVYLQKTYNNVSSNELNDIPKQIQEKGITYYLVKPVWNVSEKQQIGDNEVPVTYNGIMYYEGVKVRTIIKNYKATVSYNGKLEKEMVETVTFNMQYEKMKTQDNNIVPVVTTTSGIIIFSGIILLKRKNKRKKSK